MNSSTDNDFPTAGAFFGAMEEHITELRRRLLIAAAGFLAAVVLCFFFSGQIMDYLCRPVGGMYNLTAIEITENVSAVFDVALLAGFAWEE